MVWVVMILWREARIVIIYSQLSNTVSNVL
jgi:hypothetical protein